MFRLYIKSTLFIIFSMVAVSTHAQYNWITYTGDPNFKALEDSIDSGRILYHRSAENNATIAGRRGVLFNATFFAFPSLTGSFAWSQVRVNIGKISFYPHIYTADRGTSALSIAILYNISRVSPVRGIRTRPSFSPTSLLQLEREKQNFTRLKFVSEGFDTDLVLQTGNQETELSLSDYDINYNYWLKSSPTQREVLGLRTFFARPLKAFKIRAYSDKGYLDTTLTAREVPVLAEVFVKTIDLYQRLIDPNYVNTNTNTATVQSSNLAAQTGTRPTATNASTNARRRPTNATARRRATNAAARRRAVTNRTAQTTQTTVVTTNRRPTTRRVVRPN